ncbi:MAG TPA: sugar transferase [Candidatus Tumulicola sp.]|nr:sugar transferase [Candidatus Tumulicola sp.]
MLDRAANGLMGLAGLIVFVTTYPLIALAIKIDSRGPVIFSQRRVGLKGRTFTFYKYRTMSHEGHKPYETPKLDAEHFRTFVFITPVSRLTRVGRFLRATSLDELPNFWNVLKGDMRIVGPRPEIPELVSQYPPEYHRRHDVKPGITGLAQVSGRADLTYEETMNYDLDYVNNHSLARDFTILMKTLPAVIARKGAR